MAFYRLIFLSWVVAHSDHRRPEADGLIANSSAAQAFVLNAALGQEKIGTGFYLHNISKDCSDNLNTGDWHGNERRSRPEP